MRCSVCKQDDALSMVVKGKIYCLLHGEIKLGIRNKYGKKEVKE